MNNFNVSGTHRAVLYNAGIDDTQSQIEALKEIIQLQDERYKLMEEIVADYKMLLNLKGKK